MVQYRNDTETGRNDSVLEQLKKNDSNGLVQE